MSEPGCIISSKQSVSMGERATYRPDLSGTEPPGSRFSSGSATGKGGCSKLSAIAAEIGLSG